MKRVIFALGLAACSAPEASIQALDLDVRTPGPYQPGYTLRSVTYEPSVGASPRTLDLHIWYPTESTNFDEVSYTYEIFVDEAVVPDAAIAPAIHENGYPLQVYSHGDRGFGGSSAFLARYFATHGWVTIAPDHLDNLTFDTVEPKETSHFIHRPLDLVAAMDMVSDEMEWSSQLDSSRVVVSGHSFGSYTTWSIGGSTYDAIEDFCRPEERDCSEAERTAFSAGLGDPRVVATIPMAGTIRRSWFGDTGHRQHQAPVFFMSGTEDPVGQQGQWDAMDTIDFTWIDIEGACHNGFALGACPELETQEGFEIIQTYALAFARRHVLMDSSTSIVDILAGQTSISERVSFQRMNAPD